MDIDIINNQDWKLFQQQEQLEEQQIVECQDKTIFGGMSNMVIFKTFFIPPHFAYQINFLIFSSFGLDFSITVNVDDQQINKTYSIFGLSSCGNGDGLAVTQETFLHSNKHFSPTLQIQILLPLAINEPPFFWGIADFALFIFQCPQQCDSCNDNGICDKWAQMSIYFGEEVILENEGWLKNDEFFQGIIRCGNFQMYGPFVSQDVIKFNSLIYKDHSEIRIRFKLIAIQLQNLISLKVQVNNDEQIFSTNHLINEWYLICGEYQTFTVIDGQFPHNIHYLMISIILPDIIDTDAQFGIRDFEIFIDAKNIEIQELCNDENIYAFDGCFNFQFDCCEGCSNCVQGQCMECYYTWQYDSQNYQCLSICGDNIIVGFEECDDINQLPYDGCYQCKFSCPLNCLQCKFGICLICNLSFQLVNNICTPYNTDLLNNFNQQQLLPINHNCQPECQECYNTYCIKCLKGWNLFNYQCVQDLFNDDDNTEFDDSIIDQTICGDGIIQDLEECDDGNTVPFDGCFECQYQCEENCNDCIDGKCILSESEELLKFDCDFGFYLIDQKCLSICGDQIIASDEKCDDNNNEPYDGCFQCQYSCSLYCQNCIEGQCMKCDIGYQLQNNGCQEQQCQIENLWKCNTNDQELSICYQFDNPIIQLQYLNITFNKQYILMTSSQYIKLKESQDNLTQNLEPQIINVNKQNYIITFDFQDEPTFEEFKYIQYLFTIELLKQLEVDLIFQVSFNISLINNYDLQILNKELKLKLKNPIVLNQQQKEISTKASQFNILMLIILGVSSIIILLSGNPSDCFEVLDALQYQSYLKFINVVYPENVFIYFESSELLSIQPFLIKFNLVDLFQLIFGQELLESFGKFYFYSINADLLINFQSQICQIVLMLFFAIFYFAYVKFYYKKCFTPSQMIYIKQVHSKILEKIAVILYLINQFILSLGKMFTINGLIIWFLANSWDVLFKIILYFYSKPQNSLRTIFSIPLCIVIMLFLFTISISFIIKTAQNNKLSNLKIFRHQGLIVIKKLLFLFFLIKAQDNSILQCILIALINTIYLAIIIIAKLLKYKIDKIVIFWFELPIIMFTLLSISYHPDFVKHITNNQQLLIGFIQIAILCFGLLSPLIKYGYILIKKAKDYIIQKYKSIVAQKQKQIALEQIFL
ncbi:unnamed protein product [Paramecium pentaurelia]|uniref:Uncharacterized protein n=1 Tax=Paramecium pentaurelia TaxID=43138 RepID=A0A8S1XMW7_9CILI|nr:unnamed protein product [Paramecium pentaurelia]